MPPPDDSLCSLPSRWSDVDKNVGIEIQGDGLEVRFLGPGKPHEHEAAAVRADHAMSPQCGLYYYEVTIVSKGKDGCVEQLPTSLPPLIFPRSDVTHVAA